MPLSNLEIVLVEPQYPGNVGAVARSAKNYGIPALTIVGNLDFLTLEAKKMALYGYDLLETAKRATSLAEATADCRLVIGTVHQLRYHRSPPRPLWEILQETAPVIASQRSAIVFGREDNGLTRDETNICHHLAVIPTPADLSFNLAHAATVSLYEAWKSVNSTEQSNIIQRPTHSEYEDFFGILESTLTAIQFFKGEQRDSVMIMLRDIVYRSNLSPADLPLLKAILYKIRKTTGFSSPFL